MSEIKIDNVKELKTRLDMITSYTNQHFSENNVNIRLHKLCVIRDLLDESKMRPNEDEYRLIKGELNKFTDSFIAFVESFEELYLLESYLELIMFEGVEYKDSDRIYNLILRDSKKHCTTIIDETYIDFVKDFSLLKADLLLIVRDDKIRDMLTNAIDDIIISSRTILPLLRDYIDLVNRLKD